MASAERLLISSILRAKSNGQVKILGLKPEDFIVFKEEFRYVSENGVPSKATFKERFPEFNYVKNVAESDIPLLVDRVRDKKIRTEFASAVEKHVKQIDKKKPIDLITGMVRDLENIQGSYSLSQDVDIFNNTNFIVDEFKRRRRERKAGREPGIPTSIPTLDKETGGMAPGEVWTIVGRQGEGKTWLSLEFACSACIHNKKVLYISLEMPPELIAFRVHTLLYALTNPKAKENKFPNLELIRGLKVTPKRYRKWLKELRGTFQAKFIIPQLSRNFYFNTSSVAAKIEEHHPDLVVIDYIGLMSSDGGKGKIENWQEIKSQMRDLKTMALRYSIPIVVNAQANRAAALGEDVPKLHQIAGSDAIGADSDRVIALRLLPSRRLRIGVVKNRHGRQAFLFDCKWDINQGFLHEIPPENEEFEE